MPKLTPMMQQWTEAKSQQQDALVLFRMGDFYELFGEDAELAAPILELALTSRDKDKSGLKMAGFPVHAADSYVQKLVNQGHKVAICEQLENPKTTKGLVKRGITEIVTPGTQIDNEDQLSGEFSFLVGLINIKNIFYLCALDIKTGTFLCTCNTNPDIISDEIARLGAREILINSQDKISYQLSQKILNNMTNNSAFRLEIQDSLDNFSDATLDKIIHSLEQEFIPVVKLVWSYVRTLRGSMPEYVRAPRRYSLDQHLLMDQATQENLDLFPKNYQDKANLFTLLNKTKTAMGRRKLRNMISAPICDIEKIKNNQNIIKEIICESNLQHNLSESLKECYDIEKLTALAVAKKIGPRGLGRVRNSLAVFNKLTQLIKSNQSPNIFKLISSCPSINNTQNLFSKLDKSLVEILPAKLSDGGVFNSGYNQELDNLNKLSQEGQDLLLDLEKQERQKHNIPSLKIKYTRVFGYYIEVTRTHLNKVPDYYQRKQTIANGERYISVELSDLEIKLKTAEHKKQKLEEELFEELREIIAKNSAILMDIGQILAHLDVLASFAECAQVYNYVRPKILPKTQNKLIIKEGRHPVVENLCLVSGAHYVANNLILDQNQNILVITGPNMAGKSTVMRQAALIQIMAQLGSFVPAQEAEISICDALFARVGANDDVGRGRSTFMVEMSETGYILSNASSHSLILLDEIGRGTSTYDGISIAQAVVEYIHDTLKTRTLFATHYHELTELENKLDNLKNFHVEVENNANKINFLYMLKPGPAKDSFGVEVAKIAGLPITIISRAQNILENLEAKSKNNNNPDLNTKNLTTNSRLSQLSQLSFFAQQTNSNLNNKLEKIIHKLKKININNTTPLRALQELNNLQKFL